MSENLLQLSDEELVLLAHRGESDAYEHIINRYKNFIKGKAKMYYLVGADKDDLLQEGTIGLFKAIRDFDSSKETTFRSFAGVCVTRQIITAIKTANRQKHSLLNTYVSLNMPVYDGEDDREIAELQSVSSAQDPADAVIKKEELSALEHKITILLTKFELEVLTLYLDGYSYQRIADELNRSVKAIDNAIFRTKKKLSKLSI